MGRLRHPLVIQSKGHLLWPQARRFDCPASLKNKKITFVSVSH
jgi:hypothetical protein